MDWCCSASMAEIVFSPPSAEQLEISVFGPGYGECIVVHLGHGDWLINDSCVDSTGEPVALYYLRRIGVRVEDQVKLIVASHWHDDHVRGLREIVARCVRVHSLSPSDASLIASNVDIAQLVDEVAENRTRVAAHSPNASSVVLWVDMAGTRLLLGGDLENHSDVHRGWTAIINSETRPEGRAEVYKVAHHGSENAHDDQIWGQLLESACSALVTPWRRGGNELPQPRDLTRIALLSAVTHVTSGRIPGQVRRSRLVEEELSKSTRTIRRLDGLTGHVQMRKMAGTAQWDVCSTLDSHRIVRSTSPEV